MYSSPYIKEIRNNLPRLLALIDRDLTSSSYGFGDRYYWAWGLIDFGNATFQGMVNGLARLWCGGLWPYETSKDTFLERIDSLYKGVDALTRNDGSLEEAFPNEGSFCVTALVAYDLLVALDLLKNQIDPIRQLKWEKIIRPLIEYLLKSRETHAIISNHLATAAAALARWHLLTGDEAAERRSLELLNDVLLHQSPEGWFREYQGADPGYQSFCTVYLADLYKLRPDWPIREALQRSVQFLWHFAHPDGSFGGVYGSRCTRYYCPAGILALAEEIPEAAVLAEYMATSVANHSVVTLSSIDEPNLIPFFNSYCWAAVIDAQQVLLHPRARESILLPALDPEPLQKLYQEAGLFIDRGFDHYSIIATGKGGVVYHFEKGGKTVIDAGIVIRNKSGHFGSSQGLSQMQLNEEDGILRVDAVISQMPKKLPKPWQFLLLRMFCVTVFKIPSIRERVKQILVHMLITGVKSWPLKNSRIIKLGKNIEILDEITLPDGYEIIETSGREFIGIHMASQGYWQHQDEER